jgi:hypothetical protein
MFSGATLDTVCDNGCTTDQAMKTTSTFIADSTLGATGTITSGDHVTAPYLDATNAGATSTISGNLKVDGIITGGSPVVIHGGLEVEDGLEVNGGITATGTISADGFNTAGNATAAYFFGDGSNLTGISAGGDFYADGHVPMLVRWLLI